MSDENDLRALNELAVAFARQSAPLRQRMTALRNTGAKEKIAAELKKYAGLEPLLAALDGLGKRPDGDKASQYDRIRQDVRRKHAPHPDESIPLEQRLR